jgi:hypothetical protein
MDANERESDLFTIRFQCTVDRSKLINSAIRIPDALR